ncbi:MAG: quinol oxidase [Nitrospirae bacterium]|nr:quinol oxidase [Nitrospirota bacterium]
MKKVIVLAIFMVMSFPYVQLMAQTDAYIAKVDSDGIQRVQITAREYSFTPDHVVIRVNVPVELSVKKEAGFVPHNITLNAPETGINFSESLSTEPIIIKFTPVKTGSFAFFCNKKIPFSKSHREKGMEGLIEVRE